MPLTQVIDWIWLFSGIHLRLCRGRENNLTSWHSHIPSLLPSPLPHSHISLLPPPHPLTSPPSSPSLPTHCSPSHTASEASSVYCSTWSQPAQLWSWGLYLHVYICVGSCVGEHLGICVVMCTLRVHLYMCVSLLVGVCISMCACVCFSIGCSCVCLCFNPVHLFVFASLSS